MDKHVKDAVEKAEQLTKAGALESWAKKQAALFAKYSEGQPPESWCDDNLLDVALDDPSVCKVFQSLLEAAFLKAVRLRAHAIRRPRGTGDR